MSETPKYHYRVNVDVHTFNGIGEMSTTLFSTGFGENRPAAEKAVQTVIRHLRGVIPNEEYSFPAEDIALMDSWEDREHGFYIYVVEDIVEEADVLGLVQSVCDYISISIPESLGD